MNAVSIVVLFLILSSNLSNSKRVHVRQTSDPTAEDRNDFSSSVAGNSLELSEDDLVLQNTLQRVMSQTNAKLNRIPYNTFDENEIKTTQKPKIFFVSAVPDDAANDGSIRDIRIPVGYSEAEQETKKQIQNENITHTDNDKIKILRTNEKNNKQDSSQYPDYSTLKQKHSSSYEQDADPRNGFGTSQRTIGNNTIRILGNGSRPDDRVELKIELTLNLSENDQHQPQYVLSEEQIGNIAKNFSTGSDQNRDLSEVEETHPNFVKANQIIRETDPVLKAPSKNLNLNIRLKSPNHTETIEHSLNDNTSDKGRHQTIPESQGGARSLNARDDRRDLRTENMRNNTSHKAKKNVNNNEYSITISSDYTNPNQTYSMDHMSDVKRKATLVGSTNVNGQHELQIPRLEMTKTQTSAEETPKTESMTFKPMQQSGNKVDMLENDLSESLKKLIQNLIKHYTNQNIDLSHDSDNLMHNISRYLPLSGGTPEEQNYLHQLGKYFSQPHLFGKIDFPKLETIPDIDAILEVLKKFARSKLMRETSYYPIILKYLKFYKILEPGSKSHEESNSEEESWFYESSLIDSLMDYHYDDLIVTNHGNGKKLKSHRSDSVSSEPESDEWDLI